MAMGPLRLLLIVLLLLAPNAGGAQTIVAVVNDDVVTDRDVEQRVRLALLFTGQQPTAANAARLRPQVVRALIDQRLQMQEAERLAIEVPDAEIDAQVADLAGRNDMTPERIYQILGQVGIEDETLRDQLRTQIAWSLIARQQLLPRVVVSDVQVAQTLRSVGSGETEYRVSELFLPVYAPDQEPRVLDDARRLREALANGADFAALAEQVSISPSADRGGDLGWLAESSLPSELRSVLATLTDGGVSQPVRTSEGVYLFKRMGRRAGGAAIDLSLRQLVLSESDRVGEETVEEFVERARIDAPSCPALDTLVAETDGVRADALDNVAPATLGDAMATAALTQPIGVLSPPIRTAEGTVLVMVCSRSGAADEAARQRAEEQLQLEALERLAARYLRNLRQDAFIELRAVPG